METRRKKPESIANILKGAEANVKYGDSMRRYRLWQHWDSIVGPEIAEAAQPARWRGGILIVQVAHSAWLQELSFLKPQLVERISARLPDVKMKDIRFEIGEIKRHASKPSQSCEADVELSEEAKEFIEQAAKEIKDPELREAAARAMMKGFSSPQGRTRE